MKRAAKIIGNLDVIIAGISLCAIVFMTVAGVIMRKVVGEPFAWLEEMQLCCFGWTIFLGGSVAFRTSGQVSIDLVAARLNPNARRRMTLLFSMLDYLGIEKERTRVEWVSAAEGAKFAATMNEFVETVTALGENKRLEDLRCKAK